MLSCREKTGIDVSQGQQKDKGKKAAERTAVLVRRLVRRADSRLVRETVARGSAHSGRRRGTQALSEGATEGGRG